jgi:hypothetical protein
VFPDGLADHGAADPVSLGDFCQAHPAVSVQQDSRSINVQRTTSDLTVFEAGAPHARTYSLDDQIPFQLGDGTDDDDNGPAERPAGINIFPEADELYAEVVQFVEHFQEVTG